MIEIVLVAGLRSVPCKQLPQLKKNWSKRFCFGKAFFSKAIKYIFINSWDLILLLPSNVLSVSHNNSGVLILLRWQSHQYSSINFTVHGKGRNTSFDIVSGSIGRSLLWERPNEYVTIQGHQIQGLVSFIRTSFSKGSTSCKVNRTGEE